MPILDHAQLVSLTSWPATRDGLTVPNTDSGNVYEHACWSWALTGGTGTVHTNTGADALYNAIVRKDPFVAGSACVTGIDRRAALAVGAEAWWIGVLEKTWEGAKAGREKDQKAFKMAMLMIIAKANGLQPFLADNMRVTYSLHMRTDSWWHWDHWGLGIRYANRQVFVQTVPRTTLQHACSVMWDEHMKEVFVGIGQLCAEHARVLAPVLVEH